LFSYEHAKGRASGMVYVMVQCVVVCCSVLQCFVVCCSVLQCSALQFKEMLEKDFCFLTNTLRDEHEIWCACCCSVLQCVAVCCSVLQSKPLLEKEFCFLTYTLRDENRVCCNVVQCIAVCCSVAPCGAMYCKVKSREGLQSYFIDVQGRTSGISYVLLHLVAACCSVVQCVAISSNHSVKMLQCGQV